jgi:hypothetical protein
MASGVSLVHFERRKFVKVAFAPENAFLTLIIAECAGFFYLYPIRRSCLRDSRPGLLLRAA